MSNNGENETLSLAQDEETTLSEKPCKWIYDRSNGQSKDGDSRPPCALCWPPPCLKCMPDFFEQNCFCENMGKIGVVDADESGNSKRTLLMGIGLFSKIIGLIFTVVACFGMSSNFAFLEAFSYTKITEISENSLFGSVTMSMGLVALAVRNPPNHTLTELVVHADEYCDYVGLRFRSFVSLEDCETCTAVSTGLVAAFTSSVAAYVPAIGTNILRMYPNYDVNCQKVFGILATFFGLAGAVVTWRGYNHDCMSAFTVGTVAFNPLGNPVDVDSPDAFVHLDLNPQPGLGLIMIVTATMLKVVDIVVHVALPTPSITRSHKLQLEYEKRR